MQKRQIPCGRPCSLEVAQPSRDGLGVPMERKLTRRPRSGYTRTSFELGIYRHTTDKGHASPNHGNLPEGRFPVEATEGVQTQGNPGDRLDTERRSRTQGQSDKHEQLQVTPRPGEPSATIGPECRAHQRLSSEDTPPFRPGVDRAHIRGGTGQGSCTHARSLGSTETLRIEASTGSKIAVVCCCCLTVTVNVGISRNLPLLSWVSMCLIESRSNCVTPSKLAGSLLNT